jgi:hypothetical protein
MALKAPKQAAYASRVEQPNLEPGTYPGRIVQIIDFGLQPQRPYQGQEKKPCQEIGLTYELVDAFMIDDKGQEIEDKPRWVSESLPFYGLEADKAKSTQRYLAADPTNEHQGDFSKLLTFPVNVLIVNNARGDKVYDNVAGITAMRGRDAEKCPPLKNPAKMFDLDAPDLDVFKSFPKWIQEKIQGNLNYKGSPLQKLLGGAPAPSKEERPAPSAPDVGGGDNNPY